MTSGPGNQREPSQALWAMRFYARNLGLPDWSALRESDKPIGRFEVMAIDRALTEFLWQHVGAMKTEDGMVLACDPRGDAARHLNLYLNAAAHALASGDLRGRELSELVAVTDRLDFGIPSPIAPIQLHGQPLESKVGAVHMMAEAVASLEGKLPDETLIYKDLWEQDAFVLRRLEIGAQLVDDYPHMIENADAREIFNGVVKRVEGSQTRLLGQRISAPYSEAVRAQVPYESQHISAVDFPKPDRLSSWSAFRNLKVQRFTAAVLSGVALVFGPTFAQQYTNAILGENLHLSTFRTADGPMQNGIDIESGWAPTFNPIRSLLHPRGQWIPESRLSGRLEFAAGPNVLPGGEAGIGVIVSSTVDGLDGLSPDPQQQIERVEIEIDGTEQDVTVGVETKRTSPEVFTEDAAAYAFCDPYEKAQGHRLRISVKRLGIAQPTPILEAKMTGCKLAEVDVDEAGLQEIANLNELALPQPWFPSLFD